MLASTSLGSFKNKALIVSVLIIFLAACGKSGGGGTAEGAGSGADGSGEGGSIVEIVDPEGLFSGIGVSSLPELEDKIQNDGLLGFITQVTESNTDVEVENIVRLLNKNNRNLEYNKILQKDVPVAVIEKLKHLRMTPLSVKNMVKLPEFSFLVDDQVTPQALEVYNQARLQDLNKKLNISGQNSLSIEEFIQLQDAFSQVEITNRFGNTDKQLQNLIIPVDDSLSPQARAAQTQAVMSKGVGELPAGYSYFNPVYEEQELNLDSELPFASSTCSILADFDSYPRSISKAGEVVNDGFSSDDNGNALMHFPKPGIAVIKFLQDMPLKVLNTDGSVLVDEFVNAGQFVYLPVRSSDICDPFTFVGISNTFDVSLLAMVSPERMSTHTFINAQEYLTSDREAELINHNNFFNPISYSFASFDSALREFNLLFSNGSNSSSTAQFDILIYSPSGKVYSSSNNSVSSRYEELSGLVVEPITREPGIWRIDLLPAGSIVVNNQTLQELKPVSIAADSDREYLNVVTLVTTDNKTKHKEFVLGTLKTVSFNTEGEDGTRNPGEVNITLNTVMAPPLDIPTLLESMVDEDSGKLSDEVALWQCWDKSEKTGFELEPGNACEAFNGPYERLESLYEQVKTHGNYEKLGDRVFRLRTQCPREWEEHADSQGYCDKGIGDPYDYLPEDYAPQDRKVRYVLNDYAKTMRSRYSDEAFLYTLSRHYDLYANWVSRAVQVSTTTFPKKHVNYKTYEYSYCNPTIPCDPDSGVAPVYHSAALLEPNKPIFGAPVERLVESTAPITFDYTASDEDEYNDDAALFAVLEFVAVQTFNLFNGNFVGMICDSVGLVDDLHEIELDAEADPLGSARASINRYSTRDPFYGLHNTRDLEFYMSGLAEENTQMDTHGQRIKYAQFACGIAGLATTGSTFSANADALLNLDYGSLSTLEEMTVAVRAMAILEQSESMASNAELIAEHIRNGNFNAAKSLLKLSNNVDSLIKDQDMYSSTDQLLATYISGGSAANGNNVVKSSVQYLVGGEKKTRAKLHFERVSSIPAQQIKVTLNYVKIISNKEDDDNSDDAEIRFEPSVGEVSDSGFERLPHQPHGVMTGWISDNGIANLAYDNVKDGDTLSPETVIYNNRSVRNSAAIYIELSILEDDGNSVEDDDMVGVFSQTLKLEEIFNSGQFEWTHQGGNDYQLVINEYPVYNDKNQRVLENPLSANYEQQKHHNRRRSPSALVTMTVDVTLNESNISYPEIDTGLNPSPADEGKDTYSMEMSVVNSMNILNLDDPKVFDVLDGQVIVTKGDSHGIEGTFYSYDVNTMAMAELFSYNLDDFSGDLLPIKNSLYAMESIVPKVGYPRKKYLPLFKMLPNNHLLFVISTDDGAKIMVVSYTDQGQMTLVKTHNIQQIDGTDIYTLLNTKLSPDRKGLLVPYVPESYKGSDRTEVVHPRVAYYTISVIDGIYNVHYHSTLLEPAETVQEVDFIGNSAVAVKSIDIRYVSEDTHIWNSWLTDYEKEFQRNCSSERLICYYGYYGSTISIYNIVQNQPSAHALLLTESIDLPYYATTYPNGDPDLEYRNYSTLAQHLFSRSIIKLETVAATNRQALLRSSGAFFQLHYDDRISSYTYTGKSIFGGAKDVRFNPIGQYYCTEGIVCSGYLRQTVKPNRNDTGSYTSEINIYDFEFADMNRDLLAGITYDFEQTPAQPKLSLLSLYNGTAYKGPHIESDIFETEVVSNGANNVPGLPFTFSVMDRDTRIDQLSVEVIATTTSTTKEPARIGGHIYEANCTVDEAASANTGSHVGNCSGTILANFYNADLMQRIDVVVSDGVYTTTKSFTLNVEREAPVLTDVSKTVIVQNQDNYFSVGLNIDSESASFNVPTCTNTGTNYCHLLHNGYIDNWVVTNKPVWLTYSNVEKAYGHQALNIAGTPPMGAAGSYELQVFAIQNTKAGEVRTPMTVTIIVEEPDTIADHFSFISRGDIAKNTLVESNVITVTGINGYSNLAINSTAVGAEYWRSSTDAWSNQPATDVINGEQIRLRLMSSDEYDSSRHFEITLAGVTATFTVSTEADPDAPDSIPDAFNFAAALDQARSSLVQSGQVILSGFNQPVSMSVSNGAYSLNNQDWLTATTTVESGQSVWVQHTTAADYNSQVITTLTVGSVSASFASTTMAVPAPILPAGGGYIDATVNQSFSFIPTNSGGTATSWSIVSKPEWATFNELTGELSGVVDSTDEFTINITATNASGSDTFTSDVTVNGLSSPYINGYSSNCSIDDDQCDYTFTDNSAWRSAITQVSIQEQYGAGAVQVLTSPNDYIISAGKIQLLINATNNMVKKSGDWEIVVKALNYSDSQTSIHIDAGAFSVGPVNFSPAFEAGKITTVSTQLINRFGFGVAYQSLNTGLVTSNSDNTLNEVYRYSGGGSGFVWKEFNGDMSQNTLWGDENGNISFEVKMPGCIDAHDGFTLKVGNSSDIIYTNSDGDCVDSEWTNRYKYGVKFSEVGPAGNVYSVFETSVAIDDEFSPLGGQDIYLLKQDRNGETLWFKQLGSSASDYVNNLVVDDTGIYLSGKTYGDFDGDGLDEFTSAGGAYILHVGAEGNQTWLKRVAVDDEDSITSMTLADGKLHYILHNTTTGNSLIQRDLTGENPIEKVAADAFAGSNAIEYLQLQRDASGNYYMLTNRRLRDSNNVFSDYHRVHKFDSAGELVAQSIFLPKESGSVNLVVTDSIAYISMTTSVAITGNGFDDEVLNDEGHQAVRVAALRSDDLSIKWTRLVQSNDQYGQDSIAAGMVLAGNVLYVGVSTSGELYYNDALLTTPAATVNLVALHAGDGSELAHKSWITDPNFQPDQYNGLLNLVKSMSIGPNDSLFFTGWIKLNFNQTTYANANSIESYVLKAQLSATASTLPVESLGLSRNAYTEIVTDHKHGLQWDDRFESNNSSGYWSNANIACTGYTDWLGEGGWRLPTDLEVERTGYTPVAGSVFERVDPFGLDQPDFQVDPEAKYYYWTSTQGEGGDSSWHAAIEFDGLGDTFPNETNHHYRCVRDMN